MAFGAHYFGAPYFGQGPFTIVVLGPHALYIRNEQLISVGVGSEAVRAASMSGESVGSPSVGTERLTSVSISGDSVKVATVTNENVQ